MSKIFFKNVNTTDIAVERAKQAAAYTAVDAWISEKTKVIGIGTGTTIVYVVRRIAERFWSEANLSDIVCISTSFQARQLILDHHLPLGDLDNYPSIDVTIECANEVDESLTVINGFSGCMVQQKVVAFNSKILIIVCDYTKLSKRLGEHWCMGVPIEVSPDAWLSVKKAIIKLYDGDPVLRTAKMKVGPIITDNGNVILDWRFVERREYDWKEVNDTITMIPGVCETGLYVDVVTKVYCGTPDSTVVVKTVVPRDKCKEL